MSNWANEIKNVERGRERDRSKDEVKDAMIAANNHYAGFGSGTVNIFRNMVGLDCQDYPGKTRNKSKNNYDKETIGESATI
jgi:hypothetical protein